MARALLKAFRRRALACAPVRWVRTFAGLPRQKQLLVLRVPFLMGAAWGALRVCSFRTVVRVLRRRPPMARREAGRPRRGDGPRLSAREITWAIDAVGRRLLSEKPCLPMALVALYLLRRRGHAAVLRLGVRRQPDAATVGAHAWVEDGDGRVLIGGLRDLSSYAPLPNLEA